MGVFGTGQLANKSVHLAIRLLEQNLKEKKVSFSGVVEITQKIGDHFHNLLQEQLEKRINLLILCNQINLFLDSMSLVMTIMNPQLLRSM